jgi:hypothetical protein
MSEVQQVGEQLSQIIHQVQALAPRVLMVNEGMQAQATGAEQINHALVQLGERLSRGQNASRWYPQVIADSASPNLEIRQTAAWIMGQDHAYAPFHEALLKLLHDPEPMVRRNGMAPDG